MEWISVKEELPPYGEEFIGVWLDTGEYDGIEWLIRHPGYYYNMNSHNHNHFGGKGQMTMFSLWMPMSGLPEIPRGGTPPNP